MSAFGTVRQLGYVVADLDAAMKHWLQGPGVGPFFHAASLSFTDFHLRGVPADPHVDAAFAQCGPVQIELIQLVDDQPSAFREFADEVGEGLQHVAFWTEDFDGLVERAVSRGYTEVQRGRSFGGAPDARFAYFDAGGHHGSVVEISEQGTRKAALWSAVARAAERWDGSDPIRDLATLDPGPPDASRRERSTS